MSGRQNAVICLRLNELLSRHPLAFAPAILHLPPRISRLGRCHNCGVIPPSACLTSSPRRDETFVKSPVLTCRNLLTEFHKDRSEISECGNLLFSVFAWSHRFLKPHLLQRRCRYVAESVRLYLVFLMKCVPVQVPIMPGLFWMHLCQKGRVIAAAGRRDCGTLQTSF